MAWSKGPATERGMRTRTPRYNPYLLPHERPAIGIAARMRTDATRLDPKGKSPAMRPNSPTQVREGREVTILETSRAVSFLVDEARLQRRISLNEATETQRMYRIGQHDALLLAADEIESWDGPEASALIRELVEALEALLSSCGARGRYHALECAEAYEQAEEALSKVKPLSSPLGSDTDG